MAKPSKNEKQESLRQKQIKQTLKVKKEEQEALAEIVNVTWAADSSKNILGCYIDLPKKSDKINTYSIEIVGWVVAQKVKVLAVEIVSDRAKVMQEAPVNRPRPGVAKHYPKTPQAKNSGFAMKIGIIGLPLESELSIRAVLEDQSRATLGTLKIRRFSRLNSNYQPKLQPLIIASVGQSGADLLMQLLAGHPSSIVKANYADETLPNLYLIDLLQVLSKSGIGENYSRSDRHRGKNLTSISSYPEENNTANESQLLLRWERTYSEKLAAFYQQILDSFYQQIAKNQGLIKIDKLKKSQLIYFAYRYDASRAELVDLMWELYPQGKEIILVRDFRDVIYSMLPFSRRSKNSFDRNKYKGFQEFVYDFCKTEVASILERWKQRSKTAYLVKYEDLILSPAATLKGILEYLEVDNTGAKIEEMLAKAANFKENKHKNKSREELIEELEFWRKDTPPSLQVLCSEVCAEALDEFGYSES